VIAMTPVTTGQASPASGRSKASSVLAWVRSRAGGSDAGNAALELVVLAPVLLFVLGLVIAAGRTSMAQGAVAAAARDAARQASISLTPAAAQAAALSSASAALSQDDLKCTPVVNVDTSQFSIPVGEPATVTATVTCNVRLSGLLVPGLPGSQTLTATFTSPLDPYRER
jgi:Flp pilus assembly protein TadG